VSRSPVRSTFTGSAGRSSSLSPSRSAAAGLLQGGRFDGGLTGVRSRSAGAAVRSPGATVEAVLERRRRLMSGLKVVASQAVDRADGLCHAADDAEQQCRRLEQQLSEMKEQLQHASVAHHLLWNTCSSSSGSSINSSSSNSSRSSSSSITSSSNSSSVAKTQTSRTTTNHDQRTTTTRVGSSCSSSSNSNSSSSNSSSVAKTHLEQQQATMNEQLQHASVSRAHAGILHSTKLWYIHGIK